MPCSGGEKDIRRLRFSWGDESRPLLLSAEPEELQPKSTKVSLFIQAETMAKLLQCFDLRHGDTPKNESLTKLLQMIAPLPNARVDVKEPGGEPTVVRSPSMYSKDQAAAWLESINPNGLREHQWRTEAEKLPEAYFSRAASYLTPVLDNSGTSIGWAALNFKGQGFRTENGLCSQQPQQANRLASGDVIGVLPGFGTGPGRNTTSKPNEEILDAWLSSQLAIFRPEDFSYSEQARIASSIYNLGGDPKDFAMVALSMKRLTPFISRLASMYSINDFIKNRSIVFRRKDILGKLSDDFVKDRIMLELNKYNGDHFL